MAGDRIWISPHLFTKLWLFALTDTELAIYLAMARQRERYPYRHGTEGIYLCGDDRMTLFQADTRSLADHRHAAPVRLDRLRQRPPTERPARSETSRTGGPNVR
ncbi:hypothetical protein [Micromonospora echinaurantiaca]|uniref:hypothetical protein n=1 Tax=Micromonospora echinaurantiaca TaxID=47857 RepID=UPI001421BAEB